MDLSDLWKSQKKMIQCHGSTKKKMQFEMTPEDNKCEKEPEWKVNTLYLLNYSRK